MHPAVRSLYKELLIACRGYPEGMSVARQKLRAAFIAKQNIDLSDAAARRQVLDRGHYILAELRALSRLHKYRLVLTFNLSTVSAGSNRAPLMF
jgi:hypothetical protein